jgi:hypothetical protein
MINSSAMPSVLAPRLQITVLAIMRYTVIQTVRVAHNSFTSSNASRGSRGGLQAARYRESAFRSEVYTRCIARTRQV